MGLTQEKIHRLRKLTALEGAEKELSIESVLGSFANLETIEIPKGLESTRSGQGSLLPRADIVISSPPEFTDALLDCSPQRVVGHQIALTSIMHGE